MENTKPRKITGLFRDRESAQEAYKYLHDIGYTPSDINLVMSEEVRKTYFDDVEHYTEKGTKTVETALKGSAIGGTVLAVATILATVGISVFVPVLGVFIGGPLAAGIIGGSAGIITGGMCGALIGADIPAEKAEVYETGIKDGKIFFMVEPRNEEEALAIEKNWTENLGEEIHW